MKYFKVQEFRDYTKMAPELLCALDEFRHKTKAPVYLSPAKGAQWRNDNTRSQHNINLSAQKQSRAIDVFPSVSLWYAFLAAIEVPSIKGIGIYPHWRYKNLTYGIHLDVRDTEDKVIWWESRDREYITIHSFEQLNTMIKEYVK